MSYVPSTGNLPGELWMPSNSSDGDAFHDAFCCRCSRDRAMREGDPIEECDDDERCEILTQSFIGPVVEWRKLPNDGGVFCTAFVEFGAAPATPRCPHTADLFGGQS